MTLGGQAISRRSARAMRSHAASFSRPKIASATGSFCRCRWPRTPRCRTSRSYSRWGWLDRATEQRVAEAEVARLRIKTPSIHQQVVNLSGGNQQKVVLGKWLAMNPRVLILDEPTRGIDVGAKAEIYRHMAALAEEGITILMVSSDMEEIIGMSDRVVVMHERRIKGVLTREGLTQERIATLMTGRTEGERSGMRRELGMFVALALMCIALWISNPDFLGQSNVLNTTRQISMLGIFSIGIGFVIITGGIDLSIGSIIGLTGVLIAKISSHATRRARALAVDRHSRRAVGGAAHRSGPGAAHHAPQAAAVHRHARGACCSSAACRRRSSKAARSASEGPRCSSSPTAAFFPWVASR